ncbi:MAG: recombinase family protein [Epulopiscium sp.]|jgi:site-specific DNA recombinase|nr:recombinase family protein [Candidatus Epulonipiscium sp.]
MHQNKVAIYCRISVEEREATAQGLESESIQNQKLLLLEYVNQKGWELFDIYCDEGFSGLTEDRPSFLQMINHARKGYFDIILCKSQSRFTRNMETAEKYFHHEFVRWGIRFVTVVDHVDTLVRENKKERQIMSLVNEWYCEEISENIRMVFRKKMEAGQFVGNFAPYGYKKDENNRHRLLPQEETARVVREIFRLYTKEGYSYKKIAELLTQQQIPTPWQQKVARGEDLGRKNVKHMGVWAPTTVRRILHNRVYIGDMVQGKEQKVSFKEKTMKSIPQEQWIIVRGTHEAIVSEEVFYKAQQKKQSGKKRKNGV